MLPRSVGLEPGEAERAVCTHLESIASRRIIVTRTIRASAQQVFEALTTPNMVRQWYGLPHLPVVRCTIDLRPGGFWRWVLREPREKRTFAFSGRYLELEPPYRLVFTIRHEGVKASMHTCSIHLNDAFGFTRLSMNLVFPSRAERDEYRSSGMEFCVQQTLGALEAALRVRDESYRVFGHRTRAGDARVLRPTKPW